MIADLIHDLTSVLQAMPPAHARQHLLRHVLRTVRTNARSLSPFPSALFQCLWNASLPAAVDADGRTLVGAGLSLSPDVYRRFQLASEWRQQKDNWLPGHRWLRSVLPAPASGYLGYFRFMHSREQSAASKEPPHPTQAIDISEWVVLPHSTHALAIWDATSTLASGYVSEFHLVDWQNGLTLCRWWSSCSTADTGPYAIMPDGEHLLIACSCGNTHIAKATSGRVSGSLPLGRFEIETIIPTRGGTLAGLLTNSELSIWDASSSRQIARFTLRSGTGRVSALLHNETLFIAHGSSIFLINVYTGRLTGHTSQSDALSCFDVSPDGRQLAAVAGSTLSVCDITDRATSQIPHDAPLADLPIELTIDTCDGSRTDNRLDRYTLPLNAASNPFTLRYSAAGTHVLLFSQRAFSDMSPFGSRELEGDDYIEVFDVARGLPCGATHLGEAPLNAAISASGDEVGLFGRSGLDVWIPTPVAGLHLDRRHRSPVSHLAASPDGRLVATVEQQHPQELRLWSIRSSSDLHHLRTHAEIGHIALSGEFASAIDADQRIYVWNTSSGELAAPIISAYSVSTTPRRSLQSVFDDDDVEPVAMERDRLEALAIAGNRTLLLGTSTGHVISWDVWTQTEQGRVSLGDRPVTSIDALHPNNIVCVDDSGCVYRYAMSEDSSAWKLDDVGPVAAFAPLREDRSLVSDLTAVWMQQFDRSARPVLWCDVSADFVALSSDNLSAFTVCAIENACHARLHDLATGQPLKELMLGKSVRFAVSGCSLLVIQESNHAIAIWEPPDRYQESLSSDIIDFVFAPDGERFATASARGIVRVHDVANLRELKRLNCDDSSIQSMAFSPDGRQLAVAGRYRQLIWRWEEGGQLELAAPQISKLERLWDPSRQVELVVDRALPFYIRCLVFLRDGETLIGGGSSGTLAAWNSRDGSVRWSWSVPEARTLQGTRDSFISIAVSSNGKQLVGLLSGESIHVFDPYTGEQVSQPISVSGRSEGLRYQRPGIGISVDGDIYCSNFASTLVLNPQLPEPVEVWGIGLDPSTCTQNNSDYFMQNAHQHGFVQNSSTGELAAVLPEALIPFRSHPRRAMWAGWATDFQIIVLEGDIASDPPLRV